MNGAILVYDVEALQGVKRLTLKTPVGKYYRWNKISKSEDASH